MTVQSNVKKAVALVAAVSTLALMMLPLAGTGGASAASKPLRGLCFSPYLKVNPGVEIPASRVAALMDKLSPYCGGLRMFCSTGIWAGMPAMARSRGMSVAAGCDLCDDLAYNNAEVNGLIAQCRNRQCELAIVGDETLSGSGLSEARLIGYINKVKACGIPTTTSQTYDELLAHPKVMATCDVIVMNVYPFWEGVSLRRAIPYINTQYQKVKKAAGGKQVIVETGWPSAGSRVGAAVPGVKNANTYLKSFMSWANANGVKYYYFEAFDELWKVGSEGDVGSHWGIWDQNGVLKPGMSAVLAK